MTNRSVDSPPDARDRRADIKERARDELINYAIVSAYLFVCFAVVLFYKSALLREQGIAFLPLGIAAVKALVIGKFILIGEAVGIGTRVGRGTLLRRMLIRIVLLFMLLVVLLVAEELVVGWAHGHSVADTMVELGGRPRQEMLANGLLLLLILVPLVAVREFSRTLGPSGLRRLLGKPVAEGD